MVFVMYQFDKRLHFICLFSQVRGIGMSSPELLKFVENCPKGAETLVTRMLHILTDKGKVNAATTYKVGQRKKDYTIYMQISPNNIIMNLIFIHKNKELHLTRLRHPVELNPGVPQQTGREKKIHQKFNKNTQGTCRGWSQQTYGVESSMGKFLNHS